METQPPDKRPWPGAISIQIMVFYAGPLKRSDLSDDEYKRIVKRGDADDLEAGRLPGRLTNEAYGNLITGLTDQNEGAFFRWTLVVLLGDDEYFFSVLSKAQKDRYFDTCLAVATNRESPNMVRTGCFEALSKALKREYRHIIYADDVVKELHRTHTDPQLSSLIRSGEVNFTAKTIQQLDMMRPKIHDLRKRLRNLLKDEQEPKSVKKEARRQLHWLDRLPLIDANVVK